MDMEKTVIGVADSERTQMVSAPASNATQMAMNVECPVCRTANPPSETYCMDCGFLLGSAPLSAAEIPAAPSAGKFVATDGAREFPLNPGPNTVGRENADVLLSHNTVSRRHATVTVENDKAYVEDAGSTNGSYVAGQKVAPGAKVELTDGCDVTFGSYTLKYQAPEAAAEEQTEESAPEATEKTEMISAPEAGAEPVGEETEVAQAEEAPADEVATEQAEEMPVVRVAGRLVSKDGAVSLDIHDGANTVGRREGNDIVVPDPYASGRHAELTFADGKFTLIDIGSTNGTMVNGVKLDANAPREIFAGDEITLGRMVFRLEVA